MSKLTNIVEILKNKNYTSEGVSLTDDPVFQELVSFVSSSYATGLINGAKRFSHTRKGRKLLGVFDKPLSEFIVEIEQKFGFTYKTYDENQLSAPRSEKRIDLSAGTNPANLKPTIK